MRTKDTMTLVHARPKLLRLLIVLVSTAWSSSVLAAEGGYSNYLPGSYGDFAVAVAPEPGFVFRNDIYHYSADESRTVLQGEARFDVDLSLTINLATGLYVPDVEVLGGRYAFGALVPIVHNDIEANLSAGPLAARVQDDKTGFGDIVLIPWMLFWNFDNFHLSFAEYVVTPTGRYDKDDLANTGLNYWSFDTNLALTYLHPERGHEFSANAGFIYNTCSISHPPGGGA